MAEIPIAAVIGHPVSHSLSPEIFSFFAVKLKSSIAYRRIDVSKEELASFFQTVSEKALFTGWNVTLPHKEAMLGLVDVLSPEAKAVGAVNVVHFAKKGTKGFNTDILGICETWKEQKLKIARQSVVLFGAGGAAKAVAYAFGREKAKTVWVINRTPKRATELCAYFQMLFPKTEFRAEISTSAINEPIACVVNATPQGMKGVASEFSFPQEKASDALAFDLLYRPALTPFLKAAKKEGFRTVNGLDMLVWQALATWEIWFGPVSGRNSLKKRCKEALSQSVI